MKGPFAKITMEKEIKKLVESYENFTGSDLRIQNTPRALGTTLSKIDLKDPDNINKYISFVGQLMWYTTKVRPGIANAARELAVHMGYPGPEHWRALILLI